MPSKPSLHSRERAGERLPSTAARTPVRALQPPLRTHPRRPRICCAPGGWGCLCDRSHPEIPQRRGSAPSFQNLTRWNPTAGILRWPSSLTRQGPGVQPRSSASGSLTPTGPGLAGWPPRGPSTHLCPGSWEVLGLSSQGDVAMTIHVQMFPLPWIKPRSGVHGAGDRGTLRPRATTRLLFSACPRQRKRVSVASRPRRH